MCMCLPNNCNVAAFCFVLLADGGEVVRGREYNWGTVNIENTVTNLTMYIIYYVLYS